MLRARVGPLCRDSGTEAHVRRGLLWAIDYRGHVAQKDRATDRHADDHVPHVARRREHRPRLDEKLSIARRQITGRQARIRGLDCAGDRQRGQPMRGHALRVELHPHLASLASGELDLAHAADLLHLLLELGGEAPQLVSRVALAPERHGEHRNVVDRARLHERRRSPRRDDVHVRRELVLEPDHAPLFVLADLEAHDHHGEAGAGGRVQVLDAGDLPEQPLEGLRNALLDLLRGGPGHAHEHVAHRDDNLRLLLARQLPHGECAEEHGGDEQEWGEL